MPRRRRSNRRGQWVAAIALCAAGAAAVGYEVVALSAQTARSSAPRIAATRAPGPVAVAALPNPTPARSARPMPAASPAANQTPPRLGAPLVVRRILPINGPMQMGDYHWDEAGAPAGPIVITIDLKAQVLSIFRDGYEIGTAAILYGADEKPTPLGVFPISQKDAHHWSNLYDAPMPYMLRLTQDGVSIHASEVGPNLATHGCIGVPTPFAKKLFAATKLGDRVIITNGKTLGMGQNIT